MDLLVGTIWLRPYVFLFLLAFLGAGCVDLGWRRTLGFGGLVWPLAFAAEYSSTRTGIPFGVYTYTQITRGHELYLADVPFMDSLSFTFLAYAAFCLARVAWRGRPPSTAGLALLAGFLMMLLDVVIDPLAVRGERWFLGRIFFYPNGGPYFGVPLSNFLGWWLVGTVGVGAFLGGLARTRRGAAPPRRRAAATPDPWGRRPGFGIALYYAVLTFNLVVTAWIGEWRLAGVGMAVHLAALAALGIVSGVPSGRALGEGEIERA